MKIVGKKRKIIKYPDARLRVKSFKDGNNPKLIADMKETVMAYDGIGISAIQIGVPAKICIVFDLVMINPEVVFRSEEKEMSTEGCLSLPKRLKREVERNKEIEVRYFDEMMEQKKELFSGLEAKIVQHELDHLDGKLIVD